MDGRQGARRSIGWDYLRMTALDIGMTYYFIGWILELDWRRWAINDSELGRAQ
jgi:hypothetical protein